MIFTKKLFEILFLAYLREIFKFIFIIFCGILLKKNNKNRLKSISKMLKKGE